MRNIDDDGVRHPISKLPKTKEKRAETSSLDQSISKSDEMFEDEEELQTSTCKDSSDGSLSVSANLESGASPRTIGIFRQIFFTVAVMFVAFFVGVLLNFFVFNNAYRRSESSISNASEAPTTSPSMTPTIFPTVSSAPTISNAPTKEPSSYPSMSPTVSGAPSNRPTNQPSSHPTISGAPSRRPSSHPSMTPSSTPSNAPSTGPSIQPSNSPTISNAPSSGPSIQPSNTPTISNAPSSTPSNRPSSHPTIAPSSLPTVSQSPTKAPSRTPSRFPTIAPSDSPTRAPTRRPTPGPTPSPTAAPTIPPEILYEARLRNYLENDYQVRITSNSTNHAISRIVEEAKADGFKDMSITPKVVQRYALINMEMALFGSNGGRSSSFKQDECSWTGITCNANREVTNIRLMGKGLQGTIPSEIGLLQSLAHLDLSRNALQGSMPEELYNCQKLKKLYLDSNRLSGTISPNIINLWDLEEFNLATNRISGTIPTTMRSNGRGIYQIRYFNVYDNQMTGPMIAEGSRLRQMYYLDLGRNRFSGTIPPMDEYVRLRHLYLDFNQFTGQLPRNLVNTGNGRLKILAVNDNKFTGKLPGEHTVVNELMQFTAQNNRFSSMTERTCQLNVMLTAFYGGQSSEFKCDCNICACGNNEFCHHCYN